MLPFFALVAVGIVLAIVSLPSPRVRRADLGTAGLALVVWAVARDAGPDLLGADRVADGSAGLVAYVLLLVASCAAVLLLLRGRLVLLAVAPARDRGAGGGRSHCPLPRARGDVDAAPPRGNPNAAGAASGVKVGLSLLTLVPGVSGGSETYAGACPRARAWRRARLPRLPPHDRAGRGRVARRGPD